MTPAADGWLDRGSVASHLSSLQDIRTSHAHLFNLWLEQGILTDQSTRHFCTNGPVLQSLNNSRTSNQDWVDELGDWVDQVGRLVRSRE